MNLPGINDKQAMPIRTAMRVLRLAKHTTTVSYRNCKNGFLTSAMNPALAPTATCASSLPVESTIR